MMKEHYIRTKTFWRQEYRPFENLPSIIADQDATPFTPVPFDRVNLKATLDIRMDNQPGRPFPF